MKCQTQELYGGADKSTNNPENSIRFWRKSGVKQKTTYIFACKWLILGAPRSWILSKF